MKQERVPIDRLSAIVEEKVGVRKAMEIFNQLRFDHNIIYEEKDSIGKRYRRQDAIGTPYCITIDHDTLVDNCVTLRDRDTMKQERVPIEKLSSLVEEKVGARKVLERLG